jgi:hypothetical protein
MISLLLLVASYLSKITSLIVTRVADLSVIYLTSIIWTTGPLKFKLKNVHMQEVMAKRHKKLKMVKE